MKRRMFYPLVVVVAGLLAYSNSFTGAYFLDDFHAISENPSIRRLWPIWQALSPPRRNWLTVEGRPLINLTLAINYALGGFNVWGYHALNLCQKLDEHSPADRFGADGPGGGGESGGDRVVLAAGAAQLDRVRRAGPARSGVGGRPVVPHLARNKDYHADPEFSLGLALARLGRVPEAIEQYEQALRLKPDFAGARNRLARLQTAGNQ
jgi:tetratricopeptide (TPR) repeat protein